MNVETIKHGFELVRDGVALFVSGFRSGEASVGWVKNGPETVGSFGYDVVNAEGNRIARVSYYVHLYNNATVQDFVTAEWDRE